jgi:hypothetical protein
VPIGMQECRCDLSIRWHHLREEFLVNFQGFQMELSIEEDFLSCESLPDLCQRFVWLKAQAPEVSDYQVIT